MEKFKLLQPIIIVILVGVSIFQFMQINKLKEENRSMWSSIYSLENKLDKRSSSSIWPDIERLIGAHRENYNYLPPKR